MTIDMQEVYPWFWISDGRHYFAATRQGRPKSTGHFLCDVLVCELKSYKSYQKFIKVIEISSVSNLAAFYMALLDTGRMGSWHRADHKKGQLFK